MLLISNVNRKEEHNAVISGRANDLIMCCALPALMGRDNYSKGEKLGTMKILLHSLRGNTSKNKHGQYHYSTAIRRKEAVIKTLGTI